MRGYKSMRQPRPFYRFSEVHLWNFLPACRLFAALLLLGMTFGAVAQESVVSGRVLDSSDGSVLPGVSIQVKGTNRGVITDIEGNYRLPVQEGEVLVFSFIGYQSREYPVGSESVINVDLQVDTRQLDEVVVTALGIKRETKALGYAVTQVEGDNLSKAKEVNVINALSGKVAGVDISTSTAGPTGSTRVVIRGNSSLSGNNQPLYVIDGVPMDNTQQGSAGQWGGYDFGDGLSSLNSDDIASVSVLKGPSAAALYGSRASNGVILITTKKGTARKGIGVEFTSNATFERVLSKFDDYQTVYGQGRDGQIPTAEDAEQTTQSAWGAKLDPNLMVPIYNGELKPYGVVEDNILSFFRTGSTFTNNIALTGGNETANIRVSLSDMRNQDIVPKTSMVRNTFLINGSLRLGERLTVDGKVNYISETAKNRPALSDNPNNVGLALLGLAPSFDQKWLSEGYKDAEGNYVDWNGGNIYRINPYWSINEMTNSSSRDRVIGYLQLDYRITDWLSLNLRGGTDFYQSRFTTFYPEGTPVWEDASLEELTINAREDNYQAMLQFNKSIGEDISLSAYVGGNIMYSEYESFSATGTDIILEEVKVIQNFLNQTNTYALTKRQINSMYGALQAGYKDTYFLDVTLRNDWSSTLAPDYNSYLYPSVSGSFVFSNLTGTGRTFSFGKLRAAYAEVGGDTDPYSLSLSYGVKSFSLLGHPLGEISNTSLPKYDLKPSRTYSYEFGTDLRFFDGRLGMDLAYYKQWTRDQILSLSITSTSGYDQAVINAGEISNEGVELMLTGAPVVAGDFRWDVTVNFARNVNKVVKLHDEVDLLTLAQARWAGATVAAKEGEAYGVIMGQKMLRDPEGNIVHNAAGLPMIDEDGGQQVLGNGVYDWTSGITNAFTYKGVHLRALVDIKVGADLYSMSNAIAYANGTSEHTLEGRDEWYASEEERMAAGLTSAEWTPTGGYVGKGVKNIGTGEHPEYVENDIPTNPQDYWANLYTQSPELFIYNASYAKLRELVIGYTFRGKWFGGFMQEASLSFVGRNLFILYSDIPNVDPESNYSNSNGQGLEYGSIPSRRSYGFSLNVKF